MQRHAFVVANLAGSLRPGDDHASAVTAGLLHDVGTLALAAALPDAMAELLRGPPATPDVMLAAERARLGCTHADAGAFLLELWGLPLDIIHAVGAHEDNLRGRLSRIDLPTAVGLANRVAELTAAVHGSATDTREALAQAFPSLPDAEPDRLAILAAHAWRETAPQPIPSPGAPA
jgi:HD-like signal output (HDOD) protein